MKTVDRTELFRYTPPQLARAAIVAGVWGLFYVLLLIFGIYGGPPSRHQTVASNVSVAQGHAGAGSVLADVTKGSVAAP